MITKCPVCHSKSLEKAGEDVLVCLSCENVVSSISTEEALKRVSSSLKKQAKRDAHNDTVRDLQEKQTKKPYLRFQFRVF